MAVWIKNNKLTLALVVILLAFLSVMDGLIFSHQKNYLLLHQKAQLRDKLELFTEVIGTALVNDEIERVHLEVNEWAHRQEGIVAIRVVNGGLTVAEYKNQNQHKDVYSVQEDFTYAPNKNVQIEFVGDSSPIRNELNSLLIEMLLLSCLMLIVLAYFIKRWVIDPVVVETDVKLKSFINNMPAAVYLKDVQGRYLMANQYFEKLLGLSSKEIYGRNDHQLFGNEFADMFREEDDKVLSSNSAIEFESLGPGENGEHLYLSKKFPLHTPRGDVVAVGGVSVDISEYSKTAEQLKTTSRSLKVLSEINTAMLHATNERQWLHDICRFLVNEGGYRLAWIGFAQQGGAKNILPVADYGFDEGYLAKMNLSWADYQRGRGPVGTAVRERRTVIVNNTVDDPVFESWREDAVKRGYHSVCAIPFAMQNDMPGVLALYSVEIDAFDQSEVSLMEGLAADIDFGIQTLRTQSERVRAQEALSSEKQKFEKIVEGINAGVILLDTEARVIWANNVFQNWFGGLGEIQGEHCYLAIGLDSRDKCTALLSKKTKQVERGSAYVNTLHHGKRFFELVTAPLYDEANEISQFVQMVVDVTDQKELEIKRRDTEVRLSEAQHIASLGSWELDVVAKSLSWSDEIYRILEIDPEKNKACYDLFLDVVHPEDRDTVNKAYKESLANRQSYEIVHRLLMKDGRIKHVHQRGETNYSADGDVLVSIGTLQNITDQVKVEQALIDSEDHYRILIESTTAIPWEMDLDTMRFSYVGPQAVNVLGYPISKWYEGNFLLDRVYPDDKDMTFKLYRNAATKGEDQSLEYRMLSEDGRIVWMRDDIKVVKENGMPVRLQGFMFDVTERRHADEVLRRSQKMDAVGKLTGGIAHDFNNQLGVVQGYLDFLLEYTEGQEKPNQWVESATKATKRCIDLSRKLLDFSRQQQVEAETINVNQVLEKMHELIARTVTPTIEVNYDLEEQSWSVQVNPGELEDVLLNMAINARDAMPGGGVLSISTRNYKLSKEHSQYLPGLDANDYLLIDISDNGCGISKENKERIFEPFFTTKEDGKGTGLGLSMVYSFAQRAGGVVTLYSELDEGASFHIYLPRYFKEAEQYGDLPVVDLGFVSINGDGEVVLVVDDEDELRWLAVAFLEMLGYQTLQASNATQALTILNDTIHVDLLFTDVIMPGGISGYELADKVKEVRPEIKILFSSGFTGDVVKRTDDDTILLQKPYSKAELAQAVSDALGGNEQESGANSTKIGERVEIIEWTDELLIGYSAIDNDHNRLFKLLNEYNHAINDHSIERNAEKILELLRNYTKHHFTREEALMQACAYPDIDDHHQVHEMLIKMISDLIEIYKQGPGVFDHRATVSFLNYWLTGHIMGMDKSYAQFIEGNEEAIDEAMESLDSSEEVAISKSLKPRLIVIDDEFSVGEFVCDVADSAGFETLHYLHAAEFIAHHDDKVEVIVLDLLMPGFDGIEMIRLLAGMESKASLILISGVNESVLHSAQELAHEHGLNITGTLQKPFHPYELKKMLDNVYVRMGDVGKPQVMVSGNQKLEIEDLYEAIEQKQFIGYYQPQISMPDKQVIGFEVLMRWDHPERGLVMPNGFISLAESSGLIDEMTWQLFAQVAKNWNELGLEQSVSVNMTAGMFKSLDLPEKLHAIGEQYDFSDPSRLMLEVTESALMEELTKSLDSLTRLRMKGFQLSIDDFGTGYSSMLQLYRAPFSELKVDQSFVRRMETENEAMAIVESTIDLAHNLKMKVVAEGVESEAVLNRLAEMGCDIAQGYYIGRPMPIEDVPGWLKGWRARH